MNLFADLPLDHADSIRLFKFEGVNNENVLSLSLQATRLQDQPDYSTLSYTWRDALHKPTPGAPPRPEDAPKTIRCSNGFDLTVGGNLHSALLVLNDRSELRGRLFWVDAICIDQYNHIERGSQVSMMSEVYSQAKSVYLWLGPEDGNTQPAFGLMNSLVQQTTTNLLAITESTLAFNESLREDFRDLTIWRCLARFFCRSWFTRAWVVQEALLAREIIVLCGPHQIEWETLTEISGYLATSPWTRTFSRPGFVGDGLEPPHHGGPTKLAATKRGMSRGRQADHVLIHALIRSRKYDCRLDVDKVFSLLGLARATARPGVSFPLPDYGLGAREVYIQAALSILDNDDDLLLLCCAEGQAFRRVPELPSWVPDWSVTDLVGLGVTGYTRFDAAGGRRRILTIDREANTLDIEAYRLDSIVQVGESKRDVDRTSSFAGWLEIFQNLPTQYFTDELSSDVLWRTLLTNTVTGPNGGTQIPALADFRQAFKSWILHKSGEWQSQPPAAQEALSQLLGNLTGSGEAGNPSPSTTTALQRTPSQERALVDKYDTPFSHALCLSLFRTEQNLLGIGSLSVQTGDSIWIVPGSRVPLMFRRRTPNSRLAAAVEVAEYELVGAAYVHGKMHPGADGLGLEPEIIRIV